MNPVDAASGYRSIFLEDDWAHQKYFGWRVVRDMPGLRVLRKRRAVFTRYLLLLTAGGEAHLRPVLRDFGLHAGFTDIVVHDFEEVLGDAAGMGDLGFLRAEDHERLLNVATFVIDLSRDEDALFSGMSSDYRRKIRKAERSGLQFEAHHSPDEALVSDFLGTYAAFAKSRGIASPDPVAISRMYASGNAILMLLRKDGAVTDYLHLYSAGGTAIFMYGVNTDKQNDGAGQYLHWQALRHLKAGGHAWYDLGGVSRTGSGDGIFAFKERFGGVFVPLGCELRRQGVGVRAVGFAKRTLQRTARGDVRR